MGREGEGDREAQGERQGVREREERERERRERRFEGWIGHPLPLSFNENPVFFCWEKRRIG